MPSRKSDARRSDASVAAAAAAAAAPAHDDDIAAGSTTTAQPPTDSQTPSDKKDKDKDHRDRDAVTIEDLTLPKSIITRLARGVLPPNTQIQANAILAMSKSATVFISYLASHANEHTTNANKKTISPADVFKALEDTEFSFLRVPLEAEFAKFNAVQTEKRTSYRQKARAAKEGPSKGDDDDNDTDMAVAASSEPAAPRAKRPRIDDAETEEEDQEEEDQDAEEPDDDNDDDNEDDDEGEGEGEGEADGDGDGDEEASGDETQDALEERARGPEPDEALDGDESD